jgi:hypothetical protein
MRRTILTLALAMVIAGLCTGGVAAATGTTISLTTALQFGDDSDCNHPPASPCPASGTFTANDAATASLICPAGTIAETHWFPNPHPNPGFPQGPFTIADRTWTCPDGSTLVMHVKRVSFTEGPTPTTAHIGETWMITGGTGRLADLQGSGTMDEIFDFGVTPGTLGGLVVGVVR